ncbi:hypothetical protein HDV00_000612 [Rhizophlyctis rosea]|nr:hypothetical protein HDV00_000612 [Rhizophlyctis rosea]
MTLVQTITDEMVAGGKPIRLQNLHTIPRYETLEPDEGWRSRWSARRINAGLDTLPPKHAPHYYWHLARRELERKLIDCGGWAAMVDAETIPFIVTEGFFLDGDDAVLEEGDPCSCHHNADRLAEENPDTVVAMTGYALSDNGMWRTHSWAVRKLENGEGFQIVETTAERLAYFGHILRPEHFYIDCPAGEEEYREGGEKAIKGTEMLKAYFEGRAPSVVKNLEMEELVSLKSGRKVR